MVGVRYLAASGPPPAFAATPYTGKLHTQPISWNRAFSRTRPTWLSKFLVSSSSSTATACGRRASSVNRQASWSFGHLQWDRRIPAWGPPSSSHTADRPSAASTRYYFRPRMRRPASSPVISRLHWEVKGARDESALAAGHGIAQSYWHTPRLAPISPSTPHQLRPAHRIPHSDDTAKSISHLVRYAAHPQPSPPVAQRCRRPRRHRASSSSSHASQLGPGEVWPRRSEAILKHMLIRYLATQNSTCATIRRRKRCLRQLHATCQPIHGSHHLALDLAHTLRRMLRRHALVTNNPFLLASKLIAQVTS